MNTNMNTNLDFWKTSLNVNDNESVIVRIRDIYVAYRLNKKERMACDMFLFNPNVITAIKALEITPKAWIFVKDFLNKATKTEKSFVIRQMVLFIELGVLTRRYMRKLVVHDYLAGLTAQIAAFDESVIFRRFVREYEMEKTIKKTRD